MKKVFLAILLATSILQAVAQQNIGTYEEPWRPKFHFTPEKNWINDPNGLVYMDSTYHLFYQHNPFGNHWGHMSWGHAISKDLVHWKQLPVAIPEQKDFMIFSGCAVVDVQNTTGFAKPGGPPPIVAIFTAHREGKNQSQYLSFSLDKGLTWTFFEGNPVLDLHKKDFRDPQVSWYAPGGFWLMTVSQPLEKQVSFFRSKDLKDWTHLSNFGPAGDTTGIWECPGLFKVPVEGKTGTYKYVLMQSPSPYMQYFIGEFDGNSFRSENENATVLRPDHGPDYYAAITYENLPRDMNPVSIGWINNWNYANDIPTTPWKGSMSIPRALMVRYTDKGWRLIQKPVDAIAALEEEKGVEMKEPGNFPYSIPMAGKSWHLTVKWTVADSDQVQIQLAKGHEQETRVGYDTKQKELFLDRSHSGSFIHPAFQKLSRYSIPMSLNHGDLKLDIYFDQSIVEVFVNDGEYVLTAQVFPDEKEEELRISSQLSRSRVQYIRFSNLRSAWK